MCVFCIVLGRTHIFYLCDDFLARVSIHSFSVNADHSLGIVGVLEHISAISKAGCTLAKSPVYCRVNTERQTTASSIDKCGN